MNVRKPLTEEQQSLLVKFNEAITSVDEQKLIDSIDRLCEIPEEASPIRELAFNGDEKTINRFILAARKKTIALFNQTVEKNLEEAKKQREEACLTFESGKSSYLNFKNISFDNENHAATFSNVIMHIIGNVFWVNGHQGKTGKIINTPYPLILPPPQQSLPR